MLIKLQLPLCCKNTCSIIFKFYLPIFDSKSANMATVITIKKGEKIKDIQKKIEELGKSVVTKKGFPAAKFSGKIKSFGDGLAYQRSVRNEWQ